MGRWNTSLSIGWRSAISIGALLCSGSAAIAFSTTTPGFTSGYAVYAPFPEGLLFENTVTSGTRPIAGGQTVNLTYDAPFFIWQTPWHVLGASVRFLLSPPLVSYTMYNGTPNRTSMGNTFLAGQLTWDLGGGLGVGYRLDGYTPQTGAAASNYGTIEQRAGATYTKGDWNLGFNVIYGVTGKDYTAGYTSAPDFVNIDYHVIEKFGRFGVGFVGGSSFDTTTPILGYKREVASEVGGLASYDFADGVTLLAKVHRDIFQRNYGGYETRGYFSLIMPLYLTHPGPVAERKLEKLE